MNPNETGPIFSTATGYSEIDELNRILFVERELVLKTQENYRSLKEKYIEIERENEQIKREIERLAQEKTESFGNRQNLMDLEIKSEEVIKNMMQANEEREIRYEKFKVETIEELQTVFKKELSDQNLEIEKLKEDRQELVNENDKLLEKIGSLKSEIHDLKRKEKSKEADIREHFDLKLKKIMEENDERLSPRFEHYNQVISNLREQAKQADIKFLEKTEEFAGKIREKNSKLDEYQGIEKSLKMKVNELESKLNILENEKTNQKQEEDKKEEIITSLKKKLDAQLNEIISTDLRLRKNDREWEEKLESIETRFSKKIGEFEAICRDKDERISEMQSQLDRLIEIQNELSEVEKQKMIEEEQRQRLEIEVKNLYKKIEKIGEEKEAFVSVLKLERDKLEQSVAYLKKQLETSPDTLAEVSKLKKELKEMTRKKSIEKEKYQGALNEMKMALKSIENQQRSTQQKLRESIASRLL